MKIFVYALSIVLLLTIGVAVGTGARRTIVVDRSAPSPAVDLSAQTQSPPSLAAAAPTNPADPSDPAFDPAKLNQAQLFDLLRYYYNNDQIQVAAAISLYMYSRKDIDDDYKGRAMIVLGIIGYKLERLDIMEIAAKNVLSLKGSRPEERSLAERMLEFVKQVSRPAGIVI